MADIEASSAHGTVAIDHQLCLYPFFCSLFVILRFNEFQYMLFKTGIQASTAVVAFIHIPFDFGHTDPAKHIVGCSYRTDIFAPGSSGVEYLDGKYDKNPAKCQTPPVRNRPADIPDRIDHFKDKIAVYRRSSKKNSPKDKTYIWIELMLFNDLFTNKDLMNTFTYFRKQSIGANP